MRICTVTLRIWPSAIAVRSPELEKSKFKLEIGFPLDNVCYARRSGDTTR